MQTIPPQPLQQDEEVSRRRLIRALISTSILLAVMVAVIFGVTRLAGRQGGSTSSGNASANADQGVLLGAVPAPSFTLTDQNGATVSLDSLKGRPTVFTFFDSVCPHTDCSLMAQYINITANELGGDASRVNWVALSLNPWHDTPQTVATFLSGNHVSSRMTYLLGSPSQLQPLWDAFHMQVVEQSNGIVIHTTGVYLLDHQAREAVYMSEGFDPQGLRDDVRLLLTKGDSAFAGQQSAPVATTISETNTVDGMRVTLAVAPGQYGAYDYTVALQTTDGAVVTNARVAIDLSMPSMTMQPLHRDLQPVAPASAGTYSATGVLAMQGRWTAAVTITPQGAAQPSITSFSYTITH